MLGTLRRCHAFFDVSSSGLRGRPVKKNTHLVVLVMEEIVLPLLIKLSHVDQTILHLLQTPDLFPSASPPDLDGGFTEHRIPLHTHTSSFSTGMEGVCPLERVRPCGLH